MDGGFLLRFPQNGRNFPSAALSRTPAVAPVAHASRPALPDGIPASAPYTASDFRTGCISAGQPSVTADTSLST